MPDSPSRPEWRDLPPEIVDVLENGTIEDLERAMRDIDRQSADAGRAIEILERELEARSKRALNTMIRGYMADIEADYLDAVRKNRIDEIVDERLIEDVASVLGEMVADGKLERVGVIRKLGGMATPAYRLAADATPGGFEAVPSTAEDIARQVFPLAFRPPVRLYSRWEDAMIEQLRMYDFISSMGGREYMQGFELGMNEKHPPKARVPQGLLHMIQEDTLAKAEPVYVGQDMCDLIDHARSSFQLETVRASDAWVPAGFCLLARPIVLHDIPHSDDRELVPVRCIGWNSLHSEDWSIGSFWISFYARLDEVDKAAELAHDWQGYPLFVAHMFQWQWGERPVGDRITDLALEGEDLVEAEARATEQGQLVQTLWRLAQQFIPVRTRAPRPLRREALRKMKREVSDVNVMVLRRPSYDGDFEPTDRHYTVSFMVRGYWAIRHTREGPKQVRVQPHIKGQGPFKETTRAWEFTR